MASNVLPKTFRNHNNLNCHRIFRAKRQLSLIPLNRPRTATLSAALSNLTHPWCLAEGQWGLTKRRSAPPYEPCGSGRTLLFLPTSMLTVPQRYERTDGRTTCDGNTALSSESIENRHFFAYSTLVWRPLSREPWRMSAQTELNKRLFWHPAVWIVILFCFVMLCLAK